MYQGSNPTALKSREWLVAALIELMKTEPYEKISVRDICKQADLSRQTFYNFFTKKDDILHDYLKRKCIAQFEKLSQKEYPDLRDAVTAFTEVLDNNRILLELMIKNGLDGIISEEIQNCILLFIHLFPIQSRRRATDYGVAFLSGALAQTLLCWFKQETPLSPTELSDFLMDALTGRYYEAL